MFFVRGLSTADAHSTDSSNQLDIFLFSFTLRRELVRLRVLSIVFTSSVFRFMDFTSPFIEMKHHIQHGRESSEIKGLRRGLSLSFSLTFIYHMNLSHDKDGK